MGSFVNWDTLSTSKFGNLDFSSFDPQKYYLKNYKSELFSPGGYFNQYQIQNNAGKYRSISFNAGGKDFVFVPEDYLNRGAKEGDKTYIPINAIKGNNLQELSRNSEYVDLSNSALGNEAASKGFSPKGYLFPSSAKTSDGKSLSTIFDDPVGYPVQDGNITGISKVGDQYVYSLDRPNGYVDQTGYGHWSEPGDGGGLLGGLLKDLGPIAPIALSLFAPGIGTAIGSALGLTGVAASVVGSAITQGVLSEAQGGDFLDGAIKGAVSAGVAPAVANTVGQSVANVMADSAVKNVVANAVASSASSAVTAALTGGDVEQAALQGAVGGAAGSLGREVGTAIGLETDPFSQQTQMLSAQEQGLGTSGSAGAQLAQALGAIGIGADPVRALMSSASRFGQEVSAATPTSGFIGPVGPVAPTTAENVFVPGAENVGQVAGASENLQGVLANSNLTPEEAEAVRKAMQDVYAQASTAQALPATVTDVGAAPTTRLGSPFASNDPKFLSAIQKNPGLYRAFSEYANTYGFNTGAMDVVYKSLLEQEIAKSPSNKNLLDEYKRITGKDYYQSTAGAGRGSVSPETAAAKPTTAPVAAPSVAAPSPIAPESAMDTESLGAAIGQIENAPELVTKTVVAVDESGTKALTYGDDGVPSIVDIPPGTTVTPNESVVIDTANNVVATPPAAVTPPTAVVEPSTPSVTPTTFIPETVGTFETPSVQRGDISKGETLVPSVAPTPQTPVQPTTAADLAVSGGVFAPGTPPSTDQITVTGPVGTTGVTGGQTGLPSTQVIRIPDQISQVLPSTGGARISGGDFTGGVGGDGPIVGDIIGGDGGVIVTGEDTLAGGSGGESKTTIPPGPGVDTIEGGLVIDQVTTPGVEVTPEGKEEEPLLTETKPTEVQKPIVDPEETFIKDFFITGGYRPKTMGPTVRTLGEALAPPLFPTAPVSGLTSYRGAGEIEGQKTGKPRQNVWNEASLRLKDALGL